jgi:hypothetical protein
MEHASQGTAGRSLNACNVMHFLLGMSAFREGALILRRSMPPRRTLSHLQYLPFKTIQLPDLATAVR